MQRRPRVKLFCFRRNWTISHASAGVRLDILVFAAEFRVSSGYTILNYRRLSFPAVVHRTVHKAEFVEEADKESGRHEGRCSDGTSRKEMDIQHLSCLDVPETVHKVYLPRVRGVAGTLPVTEPSTGGPPGNETIIIVEDEDMVRQLACEALNMLGYQTLTAANPTEAIDI